MTLYSDHEDTVAIVQARLTGVRLKKKLLLDLHGYSVAEWVYQRLKRSEMVDKIVFAVPENASNDELAAFIIKMGGTVFRGSENNLVDRFHKTAHKFKAKRIVRICADNPLLCGDVIDDLIRFYDNNDCDYAYNHIPKNNMHPDGLGAEICSISLLDEIKQKAVTAEHKEHLFNYIWDNSDQYNIKTFNPADRSLWHPELKLDLDTPEDYKRLLKKPYEITMSAKEIVKLAIEEAKY